MKPFRIREQLLSLNLAIFTPINLIQITGWNSLKTKYVLHKGVKEGWLVRLKKGLYALKSDLPNEGIIANKLYKPSYISLEYVLSKYGIIPESVYEITSVTTKPTRQFEIEGKIFSYTKIKQEAYQGFRLIEGVLEAEVEKALVDYLYLVNLGKKRINERLDLRKIDWKLVEEYGQLFNRKGLMTLIKGVRNAF